MKKEYPVIEVPSDGNPRWNEGARCMVFVYSKNDGNFILKGYHREVMKYLKSNYKHYFYYLSMWYRGESRGYWKFWKNDISIFEPSRRRKVHKYKVVKYDNSYPSKRIKELDLKRLPKRWIPEFNEF